MEKQVYKNGTLYILDNAKQATNFAMMISKFKNKTIRVDDKEVFEPSEDRRVVVNEQ